MSTSGTNNWTQGAKTDGSGQRMEPRGTREPPSHHPLEGQHHLNSREEENRHHQVRRTARKDQEPVDQTGQNHNATYNYVNFHNGTMNTNEQGFNIKHTRRERKPVSEKPFLRLVHTYIGRDGKIVVDTKRQEEEGKIYQTSFLLHKCHAEHENLQQCLRGLCKVKQQPGTGGTAQRPHSKKFPADLQGSAKKTYGTPQTTNTGDTGSDDNTMRLSTANSGPKAKLWGQPKKTPWGYEPMGTYGPVTYRVWMEDIRKRMGHLRFEIARLEEELCMA